MQRLRRVLTWWENRQVLRCRKCGSRKQFMAGTGHCRPCLGESQDLQRVWR